MTTPEKTVSIEERITNYADAVLLVARSERDLNETMDELFRFARVLDGSDELRSALVDPHVPASRRQQIVEDLLGQKASDVTIAIVSLIVGAGRAADLPAIIDRFVAIGGTRDQK